MSGPFLPPPLCLRLQKLAREIVDTCPYYETLRGQDIPFHELPILDKQTINEHRHAFERQGIGKVYESFTSGSTGVPFRCIKTPEEKAALTLAIFRHRRRWGLPLRSRMLLLSNRFLAEPNMLARYTEQMNIMQPDLIQGRLSQLYELAHYIREHSLRVPPNLKFLQNWGEPIQLGQRQEVERIFGVPVVDYYGMEEMWCIAFSNQHGELEVDEQLVHLEAVEPGTGKPVPDGEQGELLVTSFVMRSIPFLRYRTGDIGRLLRDPKTGKRIVRLLPVRYSQIDLLDRRYQVAILRYLDRFFYEMHREQGLRQFQMIQESHTSFRLLVAADDRLDTTVLGRKLSAMLAQCLGVEVSLAVEWVTAIAPDPVTGKYRSFVSCLSKEGRR
jgi:phenylacetate-coenzyme A ligase PaaK-like adenylate-forming protein